MLRRMTTQRGAWTMSKALFFAVGLLLMPSQGCTQAQPEAKKNPTPPAIFVYDDRMSDLADIYNFGSDRVGRINDRDIANPAAARSHFGGPLDLCSNEQFHCLESGFYVAIPKGTLPESWSFRGIDCRSRPEGEPAAETSKIVCRACTRGVETELIYSRRRGILSYTYHYAECRPMNFVLVGEVGLFAQ